MSDDNVVRPLFGQKRSATPTPAKLPEPEADKGAIELFDPPTDPAALN